jgi:hypothetical protein
MANLFASVLARFGYFFAVFLVSYVLLFVIIFVGNAIRDLVIKIRHFFLRGSLSPEVIYGFLSSTVIIFVLFLCILTISGMHLAFTCLVNDMVFSYCVLLPR